MLLILLLMLLLLVKVNTQTWPPTTIPTIAPSTSSCAPSISPSISFPSMVPSTASPSAAPGDIITTLAGTGGSSFSGDGGVSTTAVLYQPLGVVLDSSGNVYVSDCVNQRIRKITISTGIITTIAGSSTSGSFSGDNGQSTAATLYNPVGIGIDLSSTVIYIADSLNHRIRKVTTSTSIITTIAGTGVASFSGDNGQATAATLYNPFGVALDSSGNVYIADFINCRIRKVTVLTGIITTVAGSSASASYSGDNGQATAATLNWPVAITLDSSGNLYIADCYNHRIRKVTVSTGIITSIVGTGTQSYSGDNGPATSAALFLPSGIAFDPSGNIYISDRFNHRIRKVTVSTGIITTICGTGSGGYNSDGIRATSAAIYLPYGISLDSSGNMYFADSGNNRIRKVTLVGTFGPSAPPSIAPSISPTTASPSYTPSLVPSAIPTTIPTTIPTALPSLSPSTVFIISTIVGAGPSAYSGDNDQATSAGLYRPTGVAIDASGNVYIADLGNQRIRKVTVSTGIITTIAGNGGTGSYSGDNGPATSAEFYDLYGVAVDLSGNVYTADTRNHRIRKITISSGIITTIAGSSTGGGYSGDNGQATAATLNYPHGVAVDLSGNVYTADHNNNRIRKVTVSTGIITTIAGTETSSFSGDNGPATSAELCYPYSVDVDSLGNVYIADENNQRIRKVTVSTGIITTIAGTGTSSFSGDNGPATAATLYMPSSVAVDLSGNVYIADNGNNRIRKVTVSTNVITTVAGSSTSTGYSGDGGAATSAELYYPIGVGLDSSGNIFIADCYNNRIRKVTVSTSSNPSLAPSLSPTSVPTPFPSMTPTSVPSSYFPSTYFPSLSPSDNSPSISPTHPTIIPTTKPSSIIPTIIPSASPSNTTATTNIAIPSMVPTSTPTSKPTITDDVAANLFAVPLDAEVAKVKIKYYLGAFMGYFLAIYICLYLYSFLRYGNEIVVKLYNTSHQSKVYIAVVNCDGNGSNSIVLSDLYRKNLLVQSYIKQEIELEKVKQAASNRGKMLEYEGIYSKGYREYVQQQRTLLGCAPFLYPDGYVVKIPCTNSKIALPPGRMEDILLYICHNHPLFSCFYFMEGSKLGAHGTRVLYIGKDMVIFVLYQFANMLLQYLMLDGRGLGTFINLFIITPSAFSVGIVLKNLYTCPFTETVDFQRRYAKYQSTVLFMGRLAIVPIILIMFGSLIIACLFSSNRHVPMILVNYFIYVQFYGIILAIIKAILLFKDNYSYQLSLLGVLDVLCIGRIYKERILAEQLVVNVDYAYRVSTYLFGLFKVQKILNRDDAIKANWITIGGGESTYDIEMKGNDDPVISVQVNPLMEELTARNSAVFSMDGIFSASNDNSSKEEEVGGYNVYSSRTTTNKEVLVTAENPIHSLASATQRLQPTAGAPTADVVDDDAALYLEYQNLHDRHDNTLYDMSSSEDTEVAMTFEEWKTKRKQFKQGTRGSFVKAFQMFEEREQVVRDNLEQASMKNTILLHSFKVKMNVLASPTINRPK